MDTVVHENEGHYPELRERQAYITKVIRTEEENFAKTIDGGMKIFADLLAEHKAKGETTFSGAQGMITMVVGLDDDYNCTGVYVTKHSETSGLGAKAADTNEGAWRDNLVGQGDGMKLAKDGGDITAISGATITSRAVVTEVQTVINAAKSLG